MTHLNFHLNLLHLMRRFIARQIACDQYMINIIYRYSLIRKKIDVSNYVYDDIMMIIMFQNPQCGAKHSCSVYHRLSY